MNRRALGTLLSFTLVTAVVLACSTVAIPAALADAQAPDFIWQNPLPQGNAFNDVATLGANTAWVVGDHGTIMRTADGGKTWVQQVSGTIEILAAISVVDSQTAWVCGDGSVLLGTTDGGKTWNSFSPSIFGDYSGVSAVNGQVLWLVGADAETGGALLLKSVDGGQSWIDQSPADGCMADVSAVNSNVAWAVTGGGNIYRTIDGGGTWSSTPSPATYLHNRIEGLSATRAHAVTNSGNFLKTTDGTTWSAVNLGKKFDLKDLSFADSLTGWVVGSNGYVGVTQDSGDNWSPQVSGVADCLDGVGVFGANTIFACGRSGQLLRTTDGGARWTRLSSGDTDCLLSVTSAGDRTAWASGGDGTILHTTDGGASWLPQASGASGTIERIDAVDARTAWAAGDGGTALRTTDGGASWQRLNTGVSEPLYSVSVVDADTAWVSGGNGILLKTHDAGASWQRLEPGGDKNLMVRALDELTAYCAIQDSNIILKTTDGGATWKRQVLASPGLLVKTSDLCVVNDKVAFASAWVVKTGKLGDFGMVFKTTDGGKTWKQMMDWPTRLTLVGVGSADGVNVWACGLYGIVMRTGDGGKTWQEQDALQMDSIWQAVEAVDGQTAWIAGHGGDIVRTAAPYLYSISPYSALSAGPVEIARIAGNGFVPGMAVKLVKGGKQIPADQVTVASPYRATCRFDLEGADDGEWDLVATNTNGLEGRLVRGFHVASGKTWYLAEGSTGSDARGSFETWLLLQNPGDGAVDAAVTYLTPGGAVAGPNVTLPPRSRSTVNVADTLPNSWDVATVVEAGAPVVAERAMYWDSPGTYRLSSSGSIGTPYPSRTWHLAEGSTGSDEAGGFETWVLVANPGDETANVRLSYMTGEGPVTGPTLSLPPGSRASANVADRVPGEWSISTTVESDVPVVAERNVYWNDAVQSRQSAQNSIGAPAPSTEWFMAEGSTGRDAAGDFETWICLANPSGDYARATVHYETPGGGVAGPVIDLGPFSRVTADVSASVPNEFSVSTRVVSDNPVVVERSTYYNSARTFRVAAQSSLGAPSPSADWDLVEGSTGSDARGSFETWVLVQNPGDAAADVTVRYMTPAGPVAGPALRLAPHSRTSVSVAESVPDTWSVSAEVASNVPVVAEYATYWNAPGAPRQNAHNSIGFPFQ